MVSQQLKLVALILLLRSNNSQIGESRAFLVGRLTVCINQHVLLQGLQTSTFTRENREREYP